MKRPTDAVIYLRLSREDGDMESSSIANQRRMLTAFVAGRDDLSLVGEYVDDGYSGYTFKRPKFQKMLKDAKDGKFQCIIVKDLSRLGRNFLKTEEYLQRIFPQQGMRFIAVNDCYDSGREQSAAERLTNPLINLMNEFHVAETSQKVRTVLEHHRKNGIFIGNHAPYGYRIEKKALVVDEDAAQTVKKIYQMKIAGYSTQGIADYLEQQHIPCPLEHKIENGIKPTGAHLRKGDTAKWSYVGIKRILSDPVYIGTLVQGKTTSASYRDRRRIKRDPAELQTQTFAHAHEAIVTETEFLIVQDLLARDSYSKSSKSYLFSTFAFCGGCGKMLYHRQDGKRHAWQCRNKDCTCKGNIRDDVLTDTVFTVLRTHIALIVDQSDADMSPALLASIKQKDDEMTALLRDIGKWQLLREALPAQLAQGIIEASDQEEMQRYYDQRIARAQSELETIRSKMRMLNECIEEIRTKYRCFCGAERLDRTMLATLVERVEVHAGGKVVLYLRYSDLFRNGGDTNGSEVS